MKTKLLFVVNSLEGGGAERVVSSLGNYFNSKHFSVVIVCLTKAPLAYSVSEQVKVISLVKRKDTAGAGFRALYAALTFSRLLRVLSREKPHCAISFMTTANLWTGITCRILKIPYFVSERTPPDYTIHQFNSFLKWVSFKIYSGSKSIVIPASRMREGFKKSKSFGRLNNFTTINNPVSQFKQSDPMPVHGRKFILAVGRLDPLKAYEQLIEAFYLLQPLNVDLLISGEGPERDSLQRKINSLGLSEKIKLIGFKRNIQDYYRQAEVFVLCSKNEGYPNALVEAMSFGCACVATDCEFGPSEIIRHGESGLLVEVGDAWQLARAILKVLKDPALRQKLCENARRINDTNSLDAITARWENLILSHV